ncbi:hypothetical protein M885DRAFT_610395 [Pelagophyceae sp. CCMP2097]|nr:hypothetical protein M885DRAFT_610395 [Pelagophyceae sp. CCMP2097]
MAPWYGGLSCGMLEFCYEELPKDGAVPMIEEGEPLETDEADVELPLAAADEAAAPAAVEAVEDAPADAPADTPAAAPVAAPVVEAVADVVEPTPEPTPAAPAPVAEVAVDALTREEIAAFKTKLQKGFKVIKHCRDGRSRGRVLFVDSKVSFFSWTKPGGVASKNMEKFLLKACVEVRAGSENAAFSLIYKERSIDFGVDATAKENEKTVKLLQFICKEAKGAI